MPTIGAAELRRFATALLAAGGFTREEAEQTADLLVWANLRGIDSHGVLRIPRYTEMIRLGIMRSGGKVATVREHGAVAVLDCGKCPGAVAMNAAADRAERLARTFGLGWCAARNTCHTGAIGYFAGSLAGRGLVGVAMSASKPLMSYFGARGEALSTNPFAIAVPAGENRDPIVFDMSTAAVTHGRIVAAKDAARPIPKGWAIDETGAETEDPNRVAALLPAAGPKGSGLSLTIEVLASVLAGNAVIGPTLLGRKDGGFNGLVLAIDPEAFGSGEAFAVEIGTLTEAIHGLEPAAGVDAVRLPGERGAVTARARARQGIPLAEGTASRLAATARELSVPVPECLRRSERI